MKTFTRLSDESIMPWGKYKGEELQDIPASYLIWLEGEILKKWEDGRTLFQNGILVYVSENRDVLESEAKK